MIRLRQSVQTPRAANLVTGSWEWDRFAAGQTGGIQASAGAGRGAVEAQAAQHAIGAAAVVEPGDRFLPGVTALGEAHRAIGQPSFLRHRAFVQLDAVARAPVLDPHQLGGALGHAFGHGARGAGARGAAADVHI